MFGLHNNNEESMRATRPPTLHCAHFVNTKKFSFSISQLHGTVSISAHFVQSELARSHTHIQRWLGEVGVECDGILWPEIDIDIKLMAKFCYIMQMLFKTNFTMTRT